MDDEGSDGRIGAGAAAERAGIDRSTLYRTPATELPYVEVGAGLGRRPARRYRPADVDEFRRRREAGVRQVDELRQQVADQERRIVELERWRAEHERGHPGADA